MLGVRFLCVLFIAAFASCRLYAQVPTEDELRLCVQRSFRGGITDAQIALGSQPDSVSVGDSSSWDGTDLGRMAEWALSYYRNNIHSEGIHPFATYFSIDLLRNPPTAPWWNDGLDGDTELRMLRSMPEMREIIGQTEPDPKEQGLRDAVMSYTTDGLYGFQMGASKAYILTGTAWLIGICGELYGRTGDVQYKNVGASLVQGLWQKCVWQNAAAWLPSITCDELGGPREDNIYGPLSLPEPLASFSEHTGNISAHDLADGMARALANSIQPLSDPATAYQADGRYYGQVWMHVWPALGALKKGLDSNNNSYIQFGKRVYDYTKTLGTDTGYYPEWLGTGIDGYGQPWWKDHSDHSETCIVGDTAEMAALLGKAGWEGYYDDLERMVRNYCRQVQFISTPEYESLYRQRNGAAAENGLAQARQLQGGLIASPEPNDLFNTFHYNIDMMGCCPGRGAHAIWVAWKNTVTRTSEGLCINMSLNLDTPDARVISYAPNRGRLSAVIKNAEPAVFLRPPSWAPHNLVLAFRNSAAVPVDWADDYVRFAGVAAGDELTVTYPLISFKQQLTTAAGIAGKERTWVQTWLGNTLTDIEPLGTVLPIFSGLPTRLPSLSGAKQWDAVADWSSGTTPASGIGQDSAWAYGVNTAESNDNHPNPLDAISFAPFDQYSTDLWGLGPTYKNSGADTPMIAMAGGAWFMAHSPFVIRWTAPKAMKVNVSGSFEFSYWSDSTRPQNIIIRRNNEAPLFQGQLTATSRGQVVSPTNVDVEPGDVIDFHAVQTPETLYGTFIHITGYVISEVEDSTRVVAPTFNPPGGTYGSPVNVYISCATSGSTIRFTTDGSEPASESGTVYSGIPISISAGGMVLKARAFKLGVADSLVSVAGYTFANLQEWDLQADWVSATVPPINIGPEQAWSYGTNSTANPDDPLATYTFQAFTQWDPTFWGWGTGAYNDWKDGWPFMANRDGIQDHTPILIRWTARRHLRVNVAAEIRQYGWDWSGTAGRRHYIILRKNNDSQPLDRKEITTNTHWAGASIAASSVELNANDDIYLYMVSFKGDYGNQLPIIFYRITELLTLGAPMAMAPIKAADENATVATKEVVVTAQFGNTFYVEETDRSAGVRVDLPGCSVSEGRKVRVVGQMKTDTATGERYILADCVLDVGSGSIAPVGLVNKSLGGGPMGLQEGVAGAGGINTMGLLVKVWGKVGSPGSGVFYLDDGSGVSVKVTSTGGLPGDGDYVVVTGISACEKVEGSLARVVRMLGFDPLKR